MEEKAISPTVVTLVVAAVVGTLVYFLTRREPEPKRFGLKDAEATAQIAREASRSLVAVSDDTRFAVVLVTAKAMKGMAVRVLGHEDVVGPELEALATKTAGKNEVLREEVASNHGEIDGLKNQISDLEGENEQLQLDMRFNDDRLARAYGDVALFA